MSDPAIIEAAARAMCATVYGDADVLGRHDDIDRLIRTSSLAVLAAVTSMIEAAALERAAEVAESWGTQHPVSYGVAAAIRAIKEQP